MSAEQSKLTFTYCLITSGRDKLGAKFDIWTKLNCAPEASRADKPEVDCAKFTFETLNRSAFIYLFENKAACAIFLHPTCQVLSLFFKKIFPYLFSSNQVKRRTLVKTMHFIEQGSGLLKPRLSFQVPTKVEMLFSSECF